MKKRGIPDLHLWREVKKTVIPLHSKAEPVVEEDEPLVIKVSAVKPPPPPVMRKLSHLAVETPAKSTPHTPPKSLHAFEPRLDRSIRRGKKAPDRILDLHGYTVDQAHGVLMNFLKSSYLSQARLILVITGKGSRSHDGTTGALRRNVPIWLQSPSMSTMVHSMRAAHPQYGGEGALFVYLKKRGS